MSIAKPQTLNPSLAEIEQGMSLFLSQESGSFTHLKQLSWLWNRVSLWGKMAAPLFSGRLFWKELFLAAPLVDAALHHMERMSRGDFREHEEVRLFFFQSFLKESPKLISLVEERATPALVEFLSKELPSFQKQKDFLRKKSQKEKGREENCAWYRNESFSHYVKRMEERLLYVPFESEQKFKRHVLPVHQVVHEVAEAKDAWVMTDEMKRAFRRLKERVTHSIGRCDELKKQLRLVKHRAFLVRAEDDGLHSDALLLEEHLLNISIHLEEMLSHIPESGSSSRYTKEEEAREALHQQEEELEKADWEIENIKSEMKKCGNGLSLLKKKIGASLQALVKRVSTMEKEQLKECFSDAYRRLISQAKHAIEEYRKGLLRAPGLLFPLEKLEAHIEDICVLCESFLCEERSQEAILRRLEALESSVKEILAKASGEEKDAFQAVLSGLRQAQSGDLSSSERRQVLEKSIALYEVCVAQFQK